MYRLYLLTFFYIYQIFWCMNSSVNLTFTCDWKNCVLTLYFKHRHSWMCPWAIWTGQGYKTFGVNATPSLLRFHQSWSTQHFWCIDAEWVWELLPWENRGHILLMNAHYYLCQDTSDCYIQNGFLSAVRGSGLNPYTSKLFCFVFWLNEKVSLCNNQCSAGWTDSWMVGQLNVWVY